MSKLGIIMRDHQKTNRVLSAIKLKQETYICFDRHEVGEQLLGSNFVELCTRLLTYERRIGTMDPEIQ